LGVFGGEAAAERRPRSHLENRGNTPWFPVSLRATARSPRIVRRFPHHPGQFETERFFKPEMINGMNEVGDGTIKTFPLCGIKDSPP
jgi:hypothetical protein